MSVTYPDDAVHPALDAEFSSRWQKALNDCIVPTPVEKAALNGLEIRPTITEQMYQAKRQQAQALGLDNFRLWVALTGVVIVFGTIILIQANTIRLLRAEVASEGMGTGIIVESSAGDSSTEGAAATAGHKPLNSASEIEPAAAPEPITANITHYYSTGNNTASGVDPEIQWQEAIDAGLDGIVAVGAGLSNWYDRAKDANVVIEILDGDPNGWGTAGRYLVVDRCPNDGIIDIYIPDAHAGSRENRWSYRSDVRELEAKSYD